MTANRLPAIEIYNYICIYKGYIAVNNLQDDSNTISVEDLYNFVYEQISVEDLIHYHSIGKHLYTFPRYIKLFKPKKNENINTFRHS